jgi:predicted enzyme related to lactoylglutathione lyase
VTFLSLMINLYTADMERAIAFYRDRLGGTQTFRTPAEGVPEHAEFRIGDVIIAISRREAVTRQGLPAPAPGHPMELVVGCDSADDAIAALRAAGTPVLVEPYSHPSGHRRAYVADPDGNWVCVASKESA